MRNLKKILALVLALVMSFSLMATANAFTDSEKITDTYETAVTVLDGLKVFQGYDDGSFQPQGSITRAEVATIIYRIVTGDVEGKQVGIYADYNKFDDVKSTSWYAGYVNFCANAEYIKGYDAKTFGPNDPVTGYQALAMILRALGYDKNGEFTGASWQVQTAAVGENRGITKNISAGTLGVAATREVVAEILFRAILVDTVNYTPAFGYQLNDTSLGWDTFELEEIEGVVIANEYADLYSSKPTKAGETELKVDGDVYTLNYATTLEDIGEARAAYVTEGKNVLYIADAGNTVFETGAEADIEKDKDFESVTGLERDEDTTEEFVNFDNTTYEYVTDIRISYRIFDENGAIVDEDMFPKGTELTSRQVAILEGIFTDDDENDGWVVVGTKDLKEENDISNDITWKAFCKEYFTESDTQIKDVNENENGNWLKVIDNDGDGVADYVLQTIYTMAGIEDIAKDGTITLSCDEVNLNDGDAINYVDEDIDVVAEDEVEEDDIVYYAVIDGNAYTYLAEVVTAEIDKVNRNTLTATTTDGDEYVQSGVHNHIVWNGYVDGVKNLEGDISYDLYLDKFGYLAAFTESTNNAGFVLITDGYYETGRTSDTYAAMVWNGEELVDTDITDGGERFIMDYWDANDWGNLGWFDGINAYYDVDNDVWHSTQIQTIVAALDEDGTLTPVDDLYRYREEVVMVGLGDNAGQIPNRGETLGLIYDTTRSDGAYNRVRTERVDGEDVPVMADVRALSTTIYYYVYNTNNGTVVREYVGYDNIPALGNDVNKIENVYAVASRATDAHEDDYYTAEIVVVELEDGYAELDAEQIFLVDLPEAINSVGTELARVIRADGTEAEVMIDLDKSELWANEYREYDPAWGKYIQPGLYYMWESADEADVYVIERMTPDEIADSRYIVGTVNKNTATGATNWTSIDTYALDLDPVDPLFARLTGLENSAKNVDESSYYTLSYSIDNWEQWINGSVSFETSDYSADLDTEDRDTVMAQSVKGQDANYVLVRYNSDDEVVYAISFRFEDTYADATADDRFTGFVWMINTPAAEEVVVSEAAKMLVELAKYDTRAEIVDDTDYAEAGELVAAAKALKPEDFADNDEYDALQDAIDAVETAMDDYMADKLNNKAVKDFTDAYETWLATLAAKYNWTEGMKDATAAALESYLAETDPADLDPALFTEYTGETAGDDEHNPMYAAALNIYNAQTAANSSINAAQTRITVTNAEKADLAAAATAAKAAIAAASTVKDIEAAEAIYGDAYNKVWTDRVASATAKIEAVDGKSFKNHEAITEANVKEAAGLSASDLTVWKSFSTGSQDMNGNMPVAVELGYTAYGDTSDTNSTVRISVINQYKADNP